MASFTPFLYSLPCLTLIPAFSRLQLSTKPDSATPFSSSSQNTTHHSISPLDFTAGHGTTSHGPPRLQVTPPQCTSPHFSASSQSSPNHPHHTPRLQPTALQLIPNLGYLISSNLTNSYLPQSWFLSCPMPCSPPYSKIAFRISSSITPSSSTLSWNFSTGLST